MVRNLWDTDTEKAFFFEALEKMTPQKLFYALNNEYYAYIPKGVSSQNQTLQSRNSYIGAFTEKWCKDLFDPIARQMNLFAVNNVVCEEICLSSNSNADLAFCVTDSKMQKPEDIKLLFEVKMSIVSNYKYSEPNSLTYVGDYSSHKGQPSLLRSDSMFKAIGKSINVRVSSVAGQKIPLIVLGNSPITDHYVSKVDMLKESGVIQGFWSLSPDSCKSECIRETPEKGFLTMKNIDDITTACNRLINQDLTYFSSMLSRKEIGKIIQIANYEPTDEMKADKFLQLIKE